MDRNEQERLASEHAAEISFDERKKNELIKRLTFELDRDEAEPGIGRDRDTIFLELNEVLGLNHDGQSVSTTVIDYQQLSNDALNDIGMSRCAVCGTATYPNGDPDWKHCSPDQQ